jgi:glycosyltransferase involved in cell wall biosynthesis
MAEPPPEQPDARHHLTLSAILPTYLREELLVDTVRAIASQLEPGDEILVVDQSPTHKSEVQAALAQIHDAGTIRWIRKRNPNQAEAMNVGALLAKGDLLLFLDDDIEPFPGLLGAHRRALERLPEDAVTTGQVLQPWNPEPVRSVVDYELGFDFAFDRPCEVRSLMAGNYALRRRTYLAVGGMDENYRGSNYRNDAEMAWRIHARTGRLIQFVPEAGMRHLLAAGGNRGFGSKDSWGNIGGAVGDYYFALKWLPWPRAAAYAVRRVLRAPVSRATAKRPWLIPSILLRELVAIGIASFRLVARPRREVRALADYADVMPSGSTESVRTA